MKNKYVFILLIFSCLLASSALGQRPAGEARPARIIAGTVIDGVTKTPMAGANVLIKTVTDSLLVGTVTNAQRKI